MIEDARGRIDYDEIGSGPTVVLVPGSCSTGAAWRPIMATWDGKYRCVTTSLLGYGTTAERRTESDPSIAHEVDILEAVIARAGGPVHLVGHSYGGLVSLVVALRGQVPLASLSILEAPALELLRAMGEEAHYGGFRHMTEGYFAAFKAGQKDAIAAMIDFYGGAGTWASWPERVRAYAVQTTHVNVLDWASAMGYPLAPDALARLAVPTLVVTGTASHPAARRANQLLAGCIGGAQFHLIDGAAHFMIATHAREVGALVAARVDSAT
jgi:pimeloyl-ACP methyl ester carboxylesterase